MTEKKERYYCSNNVCPSQDRCKRFVKSDKPLAILDIKDSINYLYPFQSGQMKKPFTPDKTGKCKHIVV